MALVESVEPTSPGRRRLRTRCPITDRPLGEHDVANAEDVAAAIKRARAAQLSWADRSFSQRAVVMKRALQILIKKQDHFMDRIIAETGRNRTETMMMAIFAACDSLNYYARNAEKILRSRSQGLHLLRMKRAYITYRPLGVVGIITPWNGPFQLSLNPTVQALMAGNAVIIKPSEVTPDCGKLVVELLEEAGLPEGVCQVLFGDGETGAALIEGGVNKISFTGSVATGRKVGAACGHSLIPCSLELGGKDPAVVCADADLDRAAGGTLFGAMMNTGQFCSSTERVYVVASVADEFVEKVVAEARRLVVGREGAYDIGPFISPRQLEIVEDHVSDALAKGARALVGGKRSEVGAHYFEPTVLVDVDHTMKIMTEETFGPVLPIMVVRDEDEAVEKANDTRFGLGASVWTTDRRRGEAIAARLQAGAITINDSSITYGALEVPFGGVKDSGVGRVNGAEGLRSFCHAVPVISDRFGQKREFVWYPYTEETLSGLKKAVSWLWGSPIRSLMR
ncbi:MAG: acyl-CoA reductase-like NAD-dependent aldehyde dehydrogenase [Myxococcota bacterium]|jgi:acyl-CoA reductase-like NAD-dependent aldehyde dehydrogenase